MFSFHWPLSITIFYVNYDLFPWSWWRGAGDLRRHRRHKHYGVPNHQPHGCLLNRLFRRRSKKTSKLRVTGLCVGNSLGPVNSPHKGAVTRRMFPFDDVIMIPLDYDGQTNLDQRPQFPTTGINIWFRVSNWWTTKMFGETFYLYYFVL